MKDHLSDTAETVLDVTGLAVRYATPRGQVHAVDKLDLTLRRGEVLGIIGESGCGKSTAAYAILGLLPGPGRVSAGSVRLMGEDLLTLPDGALRRRRWSRMALIPQGAMNALNPTMTVARLFAATMRTHGVPKAERAARTADLLARVGLPERTAGLYPHELSGGMKQRVCIALAIALKPDLVIADEPTSALDVVVQRTVAQTLLAIKDGMGLSMLMIGHDLGLLAQVSDRVAVMYAGRLVEVAPVAELIARPRHPYTQALVASVPTLDRAAAETEAATGITHDPHDPPPGCIFHLRCPMAQGICRAEDPPWQGDRAAGVACHFADLATPVEEA